MTLPTPLAAKGGHPLHSWRAAALTEASFG